MMKVGDTVRINIDSILFSGEIVAADVIGVIESVRMAGDEICNRSGSVCQWENGYIKLRYDENTAVVAVGRDACHVPLRFLSLAHEKPLLPGQSLNHQGRY